MKFHLTTLHVTNFEKSLDFYHNILGLEIIEQFTTPTGTTIAMLGDKTQAHLELIAMDHADSQDLGKGMSIGFQVEDAAGMIDTIKTKITGAVKGPLSPAPHVTMYFISDPDGYQVQLLEYKITK